MRKIDSTMSSSNPNNLTLTQSEKDTVIAIRLCCSFLSLFGSLFIIGSMIMFGRLKRMASRLIFCLTICALLEAFANVFSVGVYGNEIAESGLYSMCTHNVHVSFQFVFWMYWQCVDCQDDSFTDHVLIVSHIF